MTNSNATPQTLKVSRDYFLRVKKGSSVHGLLEAFQDSDTLTGEEVIAAGGQKQSPWLLQAVLGGNFDNIMVQRPKRGPEYVDGTYKAIYTDVVGQRNTTINIKQAEFEAGNVAGGAAPQVEPAVHEPLIWPSAPAILNKLPSSQFDKPSWYNMAKIMLEQGAHLSMESPPGVGKDTASKQLSAEAKVPIVFVGGDAGLRKRDLVGSPEMVNGTTHFKVSEFAAAVVNGWWAVVTEVNASEPDTLLLLNGILEQPHIINIHGNQYPVHPNFRLIVSYNAGLVGTKPLPQSFKDRFFPIKEGFLSGEVVRRRLHMPWTRLDGTVMPGMPVNDDTITVNGVEMPRLWWPEAVIDYYNALVEAVEVTNKLKFQITIRRLRDAVTLMNAGATTDIRRALKQTVVGAIDYPLQAKAAEQILTDVMRKYRDFPKGDNPENGS